MNRRNKAQINGDRKELEQLINNMNSVKDIMDWKNHPHETDNKLYTVEAWNKNKIENLGWEINETDVLYSFLGIYVIGLVAYYPDDFFVSDFVIKDKEHRKIYNQKLVTKIIKKKENEFNNKKISKENYLDNNEQLINFIKKYFSIGNIIPTWPGANVHRGCSYMYDIPDLYYQKHQKWTEKLKETYQNSWLDDFLTPEVTFDDEKNGKEYVVSFTNTKDFLKSIIGPELKKEEKISLYSKWLERIVSIITHREEELTKELQKDSRLTSCKTNI